ncbi:Ragulator complex protein LAMTOR5 [Caenorhabditis elegans]|uniref:Ragulator complex protein LAMTOR5 n=1 Tax=Caenorhabditis elegans TaxID=6239 RepID=E5QCH0_CAEEL|nr:Ragulator complex protein LAMTOR5 [Caenorhabditis elegans]CBY25152.1 Ragulator complex protein LAMTOR5 [Caenorhabditis elegans]|eukprot:NP_001256256.1 Uncharacterized protein CELE_D1054.19 [Caenorhabditis elegans]
MGCILSCKEKPKAKLNQNINIPTQIRRTDTFPQEMAEIRMQAKHVHFSNEAVLIPNERQGELKIVEIQEVCTFRRCLK